MDDKKSKNDNKQLINIIQAQYSRLSKGQKLIAQYIINNYDVRYRLENIKQSDFRLKREPIFTDRLSINEKKCFYIV